QAAFVDGRRLGPVVARRVGVRPEMDGAVQRGQGQGVAAAHIAEDFPRQRRVAPPHAEGGGEGRRGIGNKRLVPKGQRAGNTGRNSDCFRNSTPSEPPVPRLLPMLRSTSLTWR